MQFLSLQCNNPYHQAACVFKDRQRQQNVVYIFFTVDVPVKLQAPFA